MLLQHGKHPQPLEHALGALAHQHPVTREDQAQVIVHLPGRISAGQFGQVLRVPSVVRVAQHRHGAPLAGGRARHADRRAQVHHRLVEVPRARLRHKRRRLLLQPPAHRGHAHVFPDAPHPADHADHVAVHGGNPLVESNAGDGPGGVFADAADFLQRVHILRQLAAIFRRHLPRALVQVGRPAIVAQPFPQLEHLVLPCGRKRLHGRKAAKEPFIIGKHRFHPGLLEHGF